MNNTESSDAKNLLIIGNGFDLATDLKSSYADFFSWWENHGKDKNIWGAVFDYYKDLGELDISAKTNWKDVESVMATFLTNDIREMARIHVISSLTANPEFTYRLSYPKYVLDRPDFELERMRASLKLAKINPALTKFNDSERRAMVEYALEENVSSTFKRTFENLKRDNDEEGYFLVNEIPDSLFKHWYDFFFDDLHKLEANFTEYLDTCVGENIDHISVQSRMYIFEYFAKAAVLQSNLIDNELTTNILNFNYTNPFGEVNNAANEMADVSGMDIGEIKNVHGLTNNFSEWEGINTTDVVFGIDDKFMYVETDTGDEAINDNLMKFTKTNRIMRFTKTTPNMKILDNVNRIYFYGHSLGEQDYAYFQAIFDSLDIYNSDVELCFEYSQFGKDNQFTILSDRVEKLLKEYGNSMDNEAKGKNLIQKLMIEGRLTFKEIDDSWKNEYNEMLV